MTLEMLVSAALMDYNPTEQAYILKAIEEDTLPNSKRLHDGVMKVMEAFDAYEPTVEGYAGFKIDRNSVAKKKAEYKDDRNVGRVVNAGGDSMLITGKKADGRYIVVGKKGEKSARDAADLGVTKKEEVVGIDIDDLHQQMLEGLKQARANVGASKCWDGYKAKGTKKKGGKEVPNCVKEEDMEEGYKGKHGQSDKEYADSRSPGGKMVSGDSKMSGAEYTHGRRVKAANPGMQPDVGGKTKPKSQGKMDKGTRADMMYRKAKLKKEELEATGKFTAEEIERILGIEEGLGMAVKAAGKMVAKQAAQGAVDRAGEAAYNKARNMGKKPKPACEEVEVTEHHQKDAEGKVIEHEETTPSSVEEGMKQARKNVGASTCWDGYRAKGTKKKGGKEVPNCVKEEETGGVLVQDAADYTPTEIETVDVVTPEPLKNFQIEDHGVKFSEKNEEVVVDPTELIKKHAPNIAAARPLDEIAPLAALAVGAKAMAKKAVVGAAKSAARGMATNAMSKAKDRMSGSNNNNMA